LPVEIERRISDNQKYITYMKYYLNKLKFLVLAGLILFVGFIFTWFKIINIGKPGQNVTDGSGVAVTITPGQKSYANLYVDFGNGKVISYEALNIEANDTAYSLLVKKMNETGIVVQTKKYDFGLMVESIDNISASSTYFWSYLINGQAGSVAADKYILQDNDVIEWKYTQIK
jgi:hypothetical protein